MRLALFPRCMQSGHSDVVRECASGKPGSPSTSRTSLAPLQEKVMKRLNGLPGALVWSYLFVSAATVFCQKAHAVDGFDLPGFDYVSFNASSAFVCRNTCGGDSRCQAWTWVKPGVQGPAGRCWLKHRVPTLVRNSCCNSGSRENISKRDLRAEDRTDRPGSDYKNFETDSWKTCEIACAEDRTCSAWTYARRGYQGPTGRCWLKASPSTQVHGHATGT